jgi:hypothetical protein
MPFTRYGYRLRCVHASPFTDWNGHWVLEVDDHLIVDSQDLGQALGYDAAFGFTLMRGQPFYLFEQDGTVRMPYAGQTLPNVYDEVFHNQWCERSIHNVESGDDLVWFHALRNSTWYSVEAGVYDEGVGKHIPLALGSAGAAPCFYSGPGTNSASCRAALPLTVHLRHDILALWSRRHAT